MKKTKIKGIIMAGGSGSRLYPLTHAMSKQLLPVYDKPMIYYPLSTLMLASIQDILIITTEKDIEIFQSLLGDGAQWGLNLSYIVQPSPDGLPQAFLLGEKFLGDDNCAFILGDNIFYGNMLGQYMNNATERKKGATIFGYQVPDPERFGIVTLDSQDATKAIDLVEKPKSSQSNWAVTGLYFYDNDVINIAKNLKPSARGELEITDINKAYMDKDSLYIEKLGRGYAWLDAGTHESLLEAGEFVRIIEKRQGLKIACLEEIALGKGFIDKSQLEKLAHGYKNNEYGQYLMSILKRTN